MMTVCLADKPNAMHVRRQAMINIALPSGSGAMIIPKMVILAGQRKADSIVLYAGHWLQEVSHRVKCHLSC